MQRRLAAILATDVVGYSRLVRADEDAALAAVKALQGEVIAPAVAANDGRVFKLMGDGMLAEFASAVAAVRAAVAIQQALAGNPLRLRAAVNLGDVVVDGDDLHGDGVNLAARLEALAEPGGICVSAAVYDQVRDRLDVAFTDAGDHTVKNIDRPVRVWRWPAASDPARPQPPSAEAGVPSIAVLPFTDIGAGDDQAYFAAGITEDVVTALARYPWFRVVNHTPSAADAAAARYLVEGSVRRADGRIRVTARLTDSASGDHLWSDKYDRDLADIFAVQDEITRAIGGELAPQFLTAEIRRARRKTDADLDAWDLVMRGRAHLWHIDRTGNRQAQAYFEQALSHPTSDALGAADLVLALYFQLVFGWTGDRAATIRRMDTLARQACTADPDDAYALAGASFTKLFGHDIAAAVEFGRRAIAASPNLSLAHTALGNTLVFSGDYETGIASLETALRLSPRDPLRALSRNVGGVGDYLLGRYDIAESAGRWVTLEQPDMPAGHRLLAASLAQLDRTDEARTVVQDHILRLIPGHTATQAGEHLPFGANAAGRRHFLDGLVKAGLPMS